MIDSDGFRFNVGIVICNQAGELLWAKRIGQSAWQFPQGGIKRDETPEAALFRELDEEVGLAESDVTVLHETRDWLHYRLPEQFVRQKQNPVCIGQKQKWFLLSLNGDDGRITLDGSGSPEFDDWRWVNYWYPVDRVIEFKRDVYRRALQELRQPLDAFIASR